MLIEKFLSRFSFSFLFVQFMIRSIAFISMLRVPSPFFLNERLWRRWPMFCSQGSCQSTAVNQFGTSACPSPAGAILFPAIRSGSHSPV